MNTYLNALFDKHNLSKKNRYEISQMFTLLPDDKKQNLLNNFDALAIRLNKIEEDIEIEKNILVGEALSRMNQAIKKKREEKSFQLKKEMEELKKEL